jgi:hypothetical protein
MITLLSAYRREKSISIGWGVYLYFKTSKRIAAATRVDVNMLTIPSISESQETNFFVWKRLIYDL